MSPFWKGFHTVFGCATTAGLFAGMNFILAGEAAAKGYWIWALGGLVGGALLLVISYREELA